MKKMIQLTLKRKTKWLNSNMNFDYARKKCLHFLINCVICIYLVLLDQQSEGENTPPDGPCQCQKEMDVHLLACQQFLRESHIVTHLANERASFLNMNDINDIKFFGTSDCYHCCS
jgi:hypothetical protein